MTIIMAMIYQIKRSNNPEANFVYALSPYITLACLTKKSGKKHIPIKTAINKMPEIILLYGLTSVINL